MMSSLNQFSRAETMTIEDYSSKQLSQTVDLDSSYSVLEDFVKVNDEDIDVS